RRFTWVMVIFPSGMSGAYAQRLLRCLSCTWFVLVCKCFLQGPDIREESRPGSKKSGSVIK
ncbi:MAG: hypothetical protein ACREYF_05330, partial [Gammaproteobacteria bacterium]